MLKHLSSTLRLTGAASLSLAILVPAAAHGASTVSQSGGTISVVGDNAVNTVTISPGSGVTTVRDESGVVPGTGCTASGPQQVNCTLTNADAAITLLGGDDVLTINPNALDTAFVSGGAGNDTLTGSTECDTFTADAGADTYKGGNAPTSVFGCNDRMDYSGYTVGVAVTLDNQPNDGAGEGDNVGADITSVTGGSANDSIDAAATDRSVSFNGGAGDDTITGSGLSDFLGGGPGNDTVNGNNGGDSISGGDGNDNLSGGLGDDDLSGDQGTDRVDGGDGDDTFDEFGFGQAPVGSSPGFPSSTGNDEIIGGGGEDQVYYSRAFDPRDGTEIRQLGVTVTLDDQANDGEGGEGDNVRSDVEGVSGGGGDDTLTGNDASNSLSGNGGKDTIDGRGGVDLISGGAGDDSIVSRDAGFDRVNCGNNTLPGAPDTDNATTDDIDQVFNCENVSSAAVPPPPAPVVPAVDKTAPKITIAGVASSVKRKTFASKGLTFRVTTDEAASLTSELRALLKPTSRGVAFSAKVGDFVIAAKSAAMANGQRKITLKPSSRLMKALRNRKLRLTIAVTAKDAAGNVGTGTKAVRLK
jgi:Ca2+-binding RTX toxin-like protein